ncbi:PP2C family serine/threonine-protein phosphatase [Cryobacterium sp. AP23]
MVEAPEAQEWFVVGASVPGTSHLDAGIGCDDAFAYVLPGGGVALAAVSDGAGSRSGTSALGAYSACQAIVAAATRPEFVSTVSAEDADQLERRMRLLFQEALMGIEAAAAENGVSTSALSATLAVALVTPLHTIFGQVGDGIVVSDRNAGISTHIPEDKGEYANETVFLTSQRAIDSDLRIEVVDGVTAFGLSTDGLRYRVLHLDTGAPYAPFFAGLWDRVYERDIMGAELSAAINALGDAQTGDDKTLVIGILRPMRDADEGSLSADWSGRPAFIPKREVAIAESADELGVPVPVPAADFHGLA